jgi:hypothetical protein
MNIAELDEFEATVNELIIKAKLEQSRNVWNTENSK